MKQNRTPPQQSPDWGGGTFRQLRHPPAGGVYQPAGEVHGLGWVEDDGRGQGVAPVDDQADRCLGVVAYNRAETPARDHPRRDVIVIVPRTLGIASDGSLGVKPDGPGKSPGRC
jgi:hypothetical protein